MFLIFNGSEQEEDSRLPGFNPLNQVYVFNTITDFNDKTKI